MEEPSACHLIGLLSAHLRNLWRSSAAQVARDHSTVRRSPSSNGTIGS
jgi:hypothetical protein